MSELIKRIGGRVIVCPRRRVVRKSFVYTVFVVMFIMCFVFMAETLMIYSSVSGQKILSFSETLHIITAWIAEFFI